MEKYAYLLLGLSLLAIYLPIIWFRQDLFHASFKLGIVGGLTAVFTEVLFFRDYWRPITTVGVGRISPEDFIFGYTITALAIVIYPFVSRSGFSAARTTQKAKLYAKIFGFGAVTGLAGNLILGINSIVMSYLVSLTLVTILLVWRRDLWRLAICTMVLMVVITTLIYVVLFDWIAPDFWSKYWLLAGKWWGIKIVGNVPLTEIVWYASWTLFASIIHPFANNQHLVKLNTKPKI